MANKLYKIDSEDAHQAALFELLNMSAAKHPELEMIFAVPNGGYRSLTTARRLKATGVKAGVPDIFCALPRQGKAGLWLEMKSKNGTLQANQKVWLARLEAENYATAVCYSWLDAARTIENYLGITF